MPETFDVIVTNNIFGDLITDLGAALQGGLGVAASGSIDPGKVSLRSPLREAIAARGIQLTAPSERPGKAT